jgi:glyceraldehyde 3-phosphate dehydrogenase
MPRIAINGLGRIGKLLLRAFEAEGAGGEVVLLNDLLDDPESHALFLEFDSVHGRWDAAIAPRDGALAINGREMRLTAHRRIEDLPLREMGVEMVVDCTGAFTTAAALEPYLAAGVRKVVVSAPVKDGDALNLVYGINHGLYDGSQRVVTAASCTTNCLAPVVKVMHEAIGIRHGSITTIHDVTNTQTIVDRPAKNPRRARSALTNLIPTTTGSATAITLIYPELAGRLNGHAVRVPLLNASLTDCVFEMARETSVGEINGLFAEAAAGPLKGILGYEARPLVSSDYLNDTRSAIVDGLSTMVVNGTQAKVYAWYDNEAGYAWRLADVARMVARSLER